VWPECGTVAAVRSCRGQSSVEYLALWALVAIVLAGAAALTAGGLGRRLLYGVEHGLCVLVGGPCPGPPPDVADLEPCPLHRSTRSQDFHVAFAVVKLAAGLSVLEERTSDGRVSVTFADTGSGALTTAVGAHFELANVKVGAKVTASAGVTFTSGRTWRFAGQAQADAFVHHFGSDQTLLGRLGNDARRICPLCRLVGWEPDKPPPPDAVYLHGGGLAQAGASAGLGLSAEAKAVLTGALGRRRSRDGKTTWYLRLDADTAARFFVGAGLGGGAEASALAEYTIDRAGRPQRLMVRLVGRALAGFAGFGLPARFTARGAVLENESVLDLTDAGDAAAARGFVGALHHARAGELSRRLADVLARMRDHGTDTTRTFGLRDRAGALDAGVAFGVVAGAGYAHSDRQLELTGVYERLPGLGFLPRADCLAL